MLKVIVKREENIERALKRYKRKFNKTKMMQEIRCRKEYTKPSVARRQVKEKAKFKNEYMLSLEE